MSKAIVNKSGFMKTAMLALALAGVLPVAAHAQAYGNFNSQASQGRASNPVQQTAPQAPAQYQN
jgi:hypothetical protein